MKKTNTNWVTIPEETLHTPADVKKKSDKDTGPAVRHKAFWAAGFVVLALFTFGLLAPRQMANILQGNLFEATGVQEPTAEDTLKPLSIIPETPAPEAPAPAPEMAAAELEVTPEVPVVTAQTEATTIEVEPVAVAPDEAIAETPVAETPVVAQAEPAVGSEAEASQKLIEELSKQVAEYKEKEKQNTQALQQLTDMVQQQMAAGAPTEGALRGSATEAAGVTTALGQPQMPAVSGYRVNTHVAQITPQQALQQNMSGIQMQQTAMVTGNKIYRDQLGKTSGTPGSGPAEVLIVTMVLTLVGLWGWKLIKSLARS